MENILTLLLKVFLKVLHLTHIQINQLLGNRVLKICIIIHNGVKQDASVPRHTLFHMASLTTIFKDMR